VRTLFVSSRKISATRFRPNVPKFHAKAETNYDPFIPGRRTDTDADVARRREHFTTAWQL
jgi:hypothetical protein